MASTVIFFGLLIFCAHLFSYWFRKKRIPDVLMLMGIGIVIGPVLGLVTADEDLEAIGPVFSYLTLVFIMLDSGIDMSIDSLRRYWQGMVQVTMFSFVISLGMAAVVARFLGFEWQSAFLMGSMIAGTGASIVIPLVNQMKVSDKTRTVLILESAISALLSIVVALSLMESFKMGQMRVGALLGTVLASLVLALLLGVLGGVLWAGFLERIRHLQNSMFITPAFVFVLYGITESLGYSGAISVLAFGIVLGNTEYFEFSFLKKFHQKHQMRTLEPHEKTFYKELVFVFKTFFFVYIGICIPFSDLTTLLWGFIVAASLFVVRFAIIAIVGKGETTADKWTVSMLIPKGLASAVLAPMPEQINLHVGYELIPGATMIKNVTYAVIFFSVIITSLLVLGTRRYLVESDGSKSKGTVGDGISLPKVDYSATELSGETESSMNENEVVEKANSNVNNVNV